MENTKTNALSRSTFGGLPATLGGDVAAATISATLVSPIVTAIDRAVVESSTATPNRPILQTVRTHIACSFRNPRAFFNAKPFFLVWTLYAATYTVTNTSETLTSAFMRQSDQVLAKSITFLSTCLVNVPLGVWKDINFVKIYGSRPAPGAASASIVAKAQASSSGLPKPSQVTPPAGRFPRAAGATFLLRDAVTILGSVTLAPMLSSSVPESIASDPKAKTAISQLVVPILSQVAASPIHLLGMDLVGSAGRVGRTERIMRSLGPVTVMRCCRIVPAFGAGLVVNGSLRDWFHDKAKT